MQPILAYREVVAMQPIPAYREAVAMQPIPAYREVVASSHPRLPRGGRKLRRA